MADDGELVRNCLAGDAESLREFVRRFQSAVFGLCFRMLSQREDAEDVSQESFLRAFRNLHRWDPGRPLIPWLLTIAANRCRTFLSQRREREQVVDTLPEPADRQPESPALDLAEELQLGLATLRDEYRACFVLYHLNELTLSEIASVTGHPEGTVKTWLHRARKELAEHLQRRSIVPSMNHEVH